MDDNAASENSGLEAITGLCAETDEALVLRSLVGDRAAFDELFRRYRGATAVSAQSVVDSRAVAEEIAQDAFVIAFRTLPSLDDPARFGAWVRAIARFRALRVAEREKRTQTTEPDLLARLADDQSSDNDGGDPATLALRAAEREAIRATLDALSDDHREALYLHYVEEWSLERIAVFLAVPETTVKGRLFRARESLRRHLATHPLFDDLRATKGNETHERTQREQRGNPPPAPPAEADVHAGRTREPDRSLGGRGDRCGSPVQPDFAAAGGTRHPVADDRAVHRAAPRCVV